MGYLVQYWDGVSPWIKKSPLRWMMPQRRENNLSVILKVDNKMSKLFSRGYIIKGLILALTSFFSMPKGTNDIRIVFDASVRGLNDYLGDPNFMLPSMGSLIMMMGPETYMVNLDVGWMFTNFRLSSVLAN